MKTTVSAAMELPLALKMEKYCVKHNVSKSALVCAAVEFFIKDDENEKD